MFMKLHCVLILKPIIKIHLYQKLEVPSESLIIILKHNNFDNALMNRPVSIILQRLKTVDFRRFAPVFHIII